MLTQVKPEELGCRIVHRKWNIDDRGKLSEISRVSDRDRNLPIKQVYCTTALPGVVKAFHYHKIQTDFFFVVKGIFKVIIADGGKYSVVTLSEYEPKLLSIPPNLYHGFSNIDSKESIIINCCSEEYNPKKPDEYRYGPDYFGEFDMNIWRSTNG